MTLHIVHPNAKLTLVYM